MQCVQCTFVYQGNLVFELIASANELNIAKEMRWLLNNKIINPMIMVIIIFLGINIFIDYNVILRYLNFVHKSTQPPSSIIIHSNVFLHIPYISIKTK